MLNKTIHHKELKSLVESIFTQIGCEEANAKIISEIITKTELRGISSHGVIRIKDYLELWKKGRVNINPKIKIVHESPSTAVIDGDKGYGMIVGKQSMQIAIEKAKIAGTGWISVRNSNHFGIAGYYTMMALEHDMIGIAMTNANPLVAPTFSKEKMLGTNPISVSIPAGKENPFVADFATTPIARGKLDIMHKKGETAPDGYVQDKDGNPCFDPNILTEGGAILPLGGDRLHGSHKGFCLGSIVDIFSAVLSGANFGPFVPPQVSYLPLKENLTGLGLGHFFGAMRIDAFQAANEFKSYMDSWIQTFKNAKPVAGQNRVWIPGEPEREMEARLAVDGITILGKVLEELKMVCDEIGIECNI
ncbi:MAG: Ldh family oxidoreductase [Saprospiraceae bacterium]|nr:Ldh family oxidoreductase [Saprospiraceae bacterium]